MGQTLVEAKVQLGQILLAKRLIGQGQLEEALAEQQRSGHRQLLGEILIQKGFCTEPQIAAALAESYGVPYAKVSPRICDPKVVEVLPRQFCQEHAVLPMFRVHNNLTIAIADPTNLFLIEQIEHLTGYRAQVVCATATDILATLRAYSPGAGAFVLDESLPDQGPDRITVVQPARPQQSNADLGPFNQPAVVDLVNYILSEAVRIKARSIYIEPIDGGMQIRYRVEHGLIEKARPPFQMHEPVIGRLKMIAGIDPYARPPQQATIRVQLEGRPMDLCMTFVRGGWGEHAIIALSDPQRCLIGLESLGFTVQNLQSLRQVIQQRSGMLIICGPLSSGRRTTARAVLLELASPRLKICTVEDPIECLIPNVNQFQPSGPGDLGLIETIRYVAREEPDVLLLSRISDPKVVTSAAQLALAGRLVIAVMDQATPEMAIAELQAAGLAGPLLAQCMGAVLSVRLVGRICPNCRQAYQPASTTRQLVSGLGQQVETYYQGKGCPDCGHTGRLGRIGLQELLVPGPHSKTAITQALDLHRLRQAAVQDGMIPLAVDAIEKVRSGIVSIEDVSRYLQTDLAALA